MTTEPDPGTNPRLEQFKAEIADMRLKEANPAREGLLLRVGVGLLVAGVVLGIVGFVLCHGTENPLQQRDGIVLALIGVSLSVGGAALYLRHGLTQFLRFWMARVLFEQQQSRDRATSL
jgi:hypothetical protein